MGLSPTQCFITAGDVAEAEVSDRDWSAPIEWTRGPPINHHARTLLNQVITATISRDQTHLKR